MEGLERGSEEETYLWIIFHFIYQTFKAILKSLGLQIYSPLMSHALLNQTVGNFRY